MPRVRSVSERGSPLSCGYFESVAERRQIHATLYQSRDNPDWIEVYAHEEDWRDDLGCHLRKHVFRPRLGRSMVRWLIDQHTFLARDEDYYIRNV